MWACVCLSVCVGVHVCVHMYGAFVMKVNGIKSVC